MNKEKTEEFRRQLLENLTDNILPYWMEKMKDPYGGFYGRRDGYDRLEPDAPKGAILHARILWTFAAAFNTLNDPAYLYAASHAADFILHNFIDEDYGGTYWSVKADGSPLDTKKQFYAIAFIIYGLSEYYIATGDRKSLDIAFSLFESIESHARDFKRGGYVEATNRDWTPIEDMRLSDKDKNASKTMNTHLHILEAYTNLLKALNFAIISGETTVVSSFTGKNNTAGTKKLEDMKSMVSEAAASVLRLFLSRIENPTTHNLTLFFDDDWNKYDDSESYGHDIEASWLLLETAQVVGDRKLFKETLRHTRRIALAALKGRREDGSMVYELHKSKKDNSISDQTYSEDFLDEERHWWVQAENVIGQLYLSRYHSEPGSEEEEKWLDDAFESWRYISDNLVDPAGEWYWSRRADGTINRDDDKAGFWKCPYHNSRMCLEAFRLLSE